LRNEKQLRDEDTVVMHPLRKHVALLAFILAPIALFAPHAPSAAMPIDLHAYWDDRCKGCHGDSGDFARRSLRVENGRLAGTHHREDLDSFLRRHRLSDDLVAPVSAMLIAQATSTPLFKTHCAGCHGSAAAFARASLVTSNGVLEGRKSRRPVAEFLRTHGGLAPADVPTMVSTLTRVRREVDTP
jgi:hypothetical protein